uniref:hypothetical protein n=1 Tax=uncultured Sphingomonas sp. TaxID=158754 RepID=UPI0035CA61A1
MLDRTGLNRLTMYRKMQKVTFLGNVQISTRGKGGAIPPSKWIRTPPPSESPTGLGPGL